MFERTIASASPRSSGNAGTGIDISSSNQGSWKFFMSLLNHFGLKELSNEIFSWLKCRRSSAQFDVRNELTATMLAMCLSSESGVSESSRANTLKTKSPRLISVI